VFLHDNAHLHTAARTPALLEHFNWVLSYHPPYTPDLSPSNYRLFTYLKRWLRSQCFNINEELMEGVKMWLSSQAADFLHTGIQKLEECCLLGCGAMQILCESTFWRNVSPPSSSTWQHIPEEGILHSHHRENLKSYIQKLIPQYDKCLNSGGDYNEK
jgi:hypothetical protein